MTYFLTWHVLYACWNFREKDLLEDRLKSREDLVKKREDTVRRLEVEYEQKLRDEITK